MSDLAPMSMPAPPEKPDINAMHQWMKDMYTWHQQVTINGVQTSMLSQNQLMQINGLQHSGKIFFNNDMGKGAIAEIEGGVMVMKKIVTENF